MLTLARPEKRNAISDEMVLGIERFFTHLSEDVGAVVITAEGRTSAPAWTWPRWPSGTRSPASATPGCGTAPSSASSSARCPVVAALKGAVVGGGLELAAATHIRVAERSTFYALPEGQRGLFVGGGGSVRVPAADRASPG